MADNLDAGQYQPTIDAAASKYGIDPSWLTKLLFRENKFQPQGTSSAGAQGFAQFMPGTAKQYGVDVNDPSSSIEGAAHYLSDNLKRFGGNQGLATAAYNWGEGHVQNWLKSGGSVPDETQAYVSAITGKPISDWGGAGGANSRLAVSPPAPSQAPGPIDPSIIARGGYSPPIPTTPGMTINSNPIASLGGKIGDLAGNLQKDLGKSDDDKAQPKPDIKPDIPPAPGARNISPLLGGPGGIGQGQVSPVYAQRMAALNQPMAWGGGPPGQDPWAGFGMQAQPSVYGTSLASNPMWMNSWDQ